MKCPLPRSCFHHHHSLALISCLCLFALNPSISLLALVWPAAVSSFIPLVMHATCNSFACAHLYCYSVSHRCRSSWAPWPQWPPWWRRPASVGRMVRWWVLPLKVTQHMCDGFSRFVHGSCGGRPIGWHWSVGCNQAHKWCERQRDNEIFSQPTLPRMNLQRQVEAASPLPWAAWDDVTWFSPRRQASAQRHTCSWNTPSVNTACTVPPLPSMEKQPPCCWLCPVSSCCCCCWLICRLH